MNTPLPSVYDLILDASLSSLWIQILHNDTTCVAQCWQSDHRATEVLASALGHACLQLGIAPKAFRRIAIANGPGSFTGIRLALATAAGLRRAGGAAVGVFGTLHLLAQDVFLQTQSTKPIHIITPAQRGFVHYQAFQAENGRITPRSSVDLCAYEDLAGRCGEDCVYGYGMDRHPMFAKGGYCLLCALGQPRAEAYHMCARDAIYSEQDAEPCYVRQCDAYANLGLLAKRQGMDAQLAKERFARLQTMPPHSLC